MTVSERLEKMHRELEGGKHAQKSDVKPEQDSRGPTWPRYIPHKIHPPKRLPHVTAKSGKTIRVAVVPDTHVPRHQKKAWECAVSVVRDFNPHAVVIMGDFGDFESLSHHPKNRPDLSKFASECYETNIALDQIQSVASSSQFYYVEGNHEYRAVKYVNAFPHLDGLLSVPENLYILAPGTHKPFPTSSSAPRRVSNRVHVDLRGITWIPFRNHLRRAWKAPWGCGYMHSAKANGSSTLASLGRYHAAYHADNVGPVSDCKVIVYGHHHSFQMYRSPAGYEAYCSGFLGDFDADEPAFDYAGGPSPWVTGILLQEISGPLISTEQVYIKDGRALVRGKLY